MNKKTTERIYLITASWLLLALGLLLANHFLFEFDGLRQIAMILPALMLPQHLVYLRQRKQTTFSDTDYLQITVFAFIVAGLIALPFYFV